MHRQISTFLYLEKDPAEKRKVLCIFMVSSSCICQLLRVYPSLSKSHRLLILTISVEICKFESCDLNWFSDLLHFAFIEKKTILFLIENQLKMIFILFFSFALRSFDMKKCDDPLKIHDIKFVYACLHKQFNALKITQKIKCFGLPTL